MGVRDLFSKRQKRLRGEVPDVFTYDHIPGRLRVQIIHLLTDYLGGPDPSAGPLESLLLGQGQWLGREYEGIVKTLQREYGLLQLSKPDQKQDYRAELIAFLQGEPDVERVLDAVELSFQEILKNATAPAPRRRRKGVDEGEASSLGHNQAIEELNTRFRENGVGYQFEGGQIVRADSQFLHVEVLKPVLKLLSEKAYAGAQEEFLKAHKHYRHGNHKEALNEALKSFESTMKVICEKRQWKYGSKDTARNLLAICIKNGLIPEFWESQMSGLRALLEGGVPTARNKLGGHGQGRTPIEVPVHIVAYVLHMTAAAIVFLVKAEQGFSPCPRRTHP